MLVIVFIVIVLIALIVFIVFVAFFVIIFHLFAKGVPVVLFVVPSRAVAYPPPNAFLKFDILLAAYQSRLPTL